MDQLIVFLWLLCTWLNRMSPFFPPSSLLSCPMRPVCPHRSASLSPSSLSLPLTVCFALVLVSFSLRRDEVRVGSKALCQLSRTLVPERRLKQAADERIATGQHSPRRFHLKLGISWDKRACFTFDLQTGPELKSHKNFPFWQPPINQPVLSYLTATSPSLAGFVSVCLLVF